MMHTVYEIADTRGKDLLLYLAMIDLDILNVEDSPTFRNAIRAEVMDIILLSRGWTARTKGWRVVN